MSEQTIPILGIDKQVVSIKLAQPQDAEDLADILNSALQYKVTHDDLIWGTEPFTAEELHERIEKGNTYIAKVGNVPVGTLSLTLEDEAMWGKPPPIAVYVHQLAVTQGYRGLNLGKQMLDWAGHWAADNGRELLRLDFPSKNEGLKAYYEKLGFRWVRDREMPSPQATYVAALYERPIEL